LARVVDGAERPLTAEEMQVIIFNETDGSLMYSTDDFGLDQETWQLSIKMISIRSDEPAIDPQFSFSITF